MPLYKGTTEISSNKLYKASTNIENGYKGTSSFYINQVTIEFASITGLGSGVPIRNFLASSKVSMINEESLRSKHNLGTTTTNDECREIHANVLVNHAGNGSPQDHRS